MEDERVVVRKFPIRIKVVWLLVVRQRGCLGLAVNVNFMVKGSSLVLVTFNLNFGN
jgi:hypothetical protein